MKLSIKAIKKILVMWIQEHLKTKQLSTKIILFYQRKKVNKPIDIIFTVNNQNVGSPDYFIRFRSFIKPSTCWW